MSVAASPEYVIEVENLSKKFGDFTAVDNLTMKIPRGYVYGFLGPNGSGKTTAIRMMCGLLTPTEGRVKVLGMAVPKDAEQVRLQVGYMTQRFSLYEDMTISENLQFLGRVNGIDKKQLQQRIDEVLATFRLLEFRHAIVGPMSGGQKRRLALAAAILKSPKLLILDEPTSEVDPNTRREMWEILFQLADQGTTVLVSTHLMDEAERCHYLTIMDNGKMVADGDTQTLKHNINAAVYLIKGDNTPGLRPLLLAHDDIDAVTQVGLDLRLLVDKQSTMDACDVQALIGNDYRVDSIPASMEDVFVIATRGDG
ncbi:putative multidrug ABC transporter ATP-binding protein YbhF [Sinobacterium norvegicum]|uniref:Multidrug ABC transporter ATP-binding protein YbhF n=1 Tax=Sinobacterium norvegicum TaxID=1641715 RepID=A0ABN8ELU3_9GAMM|nr:ABC transporter ATP-binding protein [Sinobacterium norvegicum]CAH0992130.1 putative multidrug ABC transporter ATP-binding protein YbhF [Sinobacterium norvegicum]